MDVQTQVFKALADPNRRRLLDRLIAEPQSVGMLTKELGVSQPAVSQHLQMLRNAGLVTDRKEGRQRIYSVEPAPLFTIAQWLEKYEAFWDQKVGALRTLLEEKGN